LRSVVTLVCIIVDDHVGTVVLSRSHILEIVQVQRVGKDVVRMDALKFITLLLDIVWVTQAVELIFSQDIHLELISVVLLLLDGPLAVFLIEGDPVVVNILINLDITNLEAREALVELGLQDVTEVPNNVEDDEGDHHGPLDAVPALVREDATHRVLRDVGVR